MFRALFSVALLAAALLHTSVAHGQADGPQAQLWDGAMQGDTVVMAAALRQGAVIDSLEIRQNPNGRRALDWAAWYNRVPAIQFLLGHGAPLEARNITGFTALHHAAESGSVEALEALLKAGADPRAANYAGRLPVETARERGQVRVVMILETVPSAKAAQQ